MIHELVRERIARGVWQPGDKIDDRLLCEELGVSRLSVREALSRLVATGTIVLESWKGYRLRELDREDIDSILDVRLSLEELGIRGAVTHRSEQMFSELEQAIALSSRYRENSEIVAFRRADTHFHEIIYRASGNRWIENVLGNLRPLIDAIWFISQADSFASVTHESVAEHQEILAALGSGEEEKALDAMRRHMANHRERVHEHYQNVKTGGEKSGT